MTSRSHVVYREEPGSDGQTAWYTYGYPDPVYAVGSSLEDLRSQVREARSWTEDVAPFSEVVEHVERSATPHVFLRVALDDSVRDREYLESALRAAFEQPDGHRPDLATFLTASGDAAVVCCVAGDLLAWVLEQMGDEDVLSVAMAVSHIGVCGSALAGPRALPQPEQGEPLAHLGLDETSTVGEFLTAATASPRPRPVVRVS